MFRLLATPSLLVLAMLLPLGAEPGTDLAIDSERGKRLHREFSAEAFFELESVGKPLDFGDLDHALLSAAIFHETNRRRAAHDRPALRYLPELRSAARIQAQGMRRTQAVSHQHPDPEVASLGERLAEVGLEPRFQAENVAMVFGIRYESGSDYFPRREDDRWVLSATPDGPPIPPHSYGSFAASLVDGWMNSPGHRRNLLHRSAEFVGHACLHQPSPKSPDQFYCAQVFFAPLGSVGE